MSKLLANTLLELTRQLVEKDSNARTHKFHREQADEARRQTQLDFNAVKAKADLQWQKIREMERTEIALAQFKELCRRVLVDIKAKKKVSPLTVRLIKNAFEQKP